MNAAPLELDGHQRVAVGAFAQETDPAPTNGEFVLSSEKTQRLERFPEQVRKISV